MTPEEIAYYQQHAFDIGDPVEIDGSGIIGVVKGFQVVDGQQDAYLVSYHDRGGNPQERWWTADVLDYFDDDEPQSNVIEFPIERTAMGRIYARGNSTKH